MEINPNLQLLIEKIFDDEQMLDQITQTGNMEELYRTCLMIQDGYTLEEFVDFFERLVYICREESDKIEKLKDIGLKDVSGGVSNLNRLTASALASLTFLAGSHLGSYAQSVNGGDSTASSNVVLRKAAPGENEEIKNPFVFRNDIEGKKLSFFEKIKEFLSGLFSKDSRSKKVSKDFDYRKGAERLDFLFKNAIHGHESVKAQLKTFYNIFASAFEDEKNGIATMEQISPQILVFDGPNSVGKSYTAKLFAQCLTDVEPFVVNAGAIVKDVEASKVGGRGGIDVTTAFWTGSRYGGGVYYKPNHKGKSYDNLVSYLSANKGSVRVVIVEDYDKLYESGAKHPLDESFRDILSNRVNDPFTQVPLDLSKTIFICTTNETKASLQGRIVMKDGRLREKAVDENGNLMFDENGYQVYIDPTDDDSGMRPNIPHDPSLMYHMASQVFYFDQLTHEDYIKIVHDALDDDPTVKTLEDLKALGGVSKIMAYHRVRYGLAGIEMDPESYELIAYYAAGTKSATIAIVGSKGNVIGSVAGNLDVALIEQIGKWCSNGYSVKNMKIKIIPRLEKNYAGKSVVKFDVKCLGYAD